MSTDLEVSLNVKKTDMCGLTTTQFTGHRILFVEVCTNLVHNDVDGLSGYALGGSS